MHKHSAYIISIAALVIACSQPLARADKGEALPPLEKLDRAQTLIYNLNHVQGSSGYYLLESIKELKNLDHEIGKALFQVKEADKSYAKLRGVPDSRFLEPVSIKLQKAQQARDQLEEDLRDAYTQLKESIQDTLVTDLGRKKH